MFESEEYEIPRNFDSDHEHPDGLQFVELVDCPGCGLTFEGTFTDSSGDVNDCVDPPAGQHTCPRCARAWASTATGWHFFSEAG